MIILLRLLYVAILLIIMALTVWSALHKNILAIPPVVLSDVWFKATLFDAYFAFLSFSLWICFREKSVALKIFLFFAIVFLGNIAMSVYVLVALYRLKTGEGMDGLFARR